MSATPSLTSRTNLCLMALLSCAAWATMLGVSLSASFTWTGLAPTDDWNAISPGSGTTNWVTGGNFLLIPDSDDTALFDSSSTGSIVVDLNGVRRVLSVTMTGALPIDLTPAGNILELVTGDLTASATFNTFQVQTNVRLLSNGTWNISQSGSPPALNVTGSISQSGGVFGINKTSSGTLVLSGNNSYSGTTTISSGTLQIGNGGTTGSVPGNISVFSTAELVFDRSNTLVHSGAINGAGAVTKQGAGAVILTGNNSYGGGTTITSGTLQIGSGGSTGSITGNVVNNGSLIFNRATTLSYSGQISGSGSLTKSGGGTLILNGNNTYAGVTTISGGTLQIGGGGTSGSIAGNIVNNSGLAVNRSNTFVMSNQISGNGPLTKQGAGTLTLTANNSSYFGTTTISSGTLQIGNGGSTGSVNGNIINNSNLIFSRGNSSLYSGVISGSGGVTKLGGGTLTLSGNNSYLGGTTLADGFVSISADANLGDSSGAIQAAGGHLRVTGTHSTSREIAIAVGLTIDVVSGVTYTADGLFTGNEPLTKLGGGTLIVSADNAYDGVTTINGGTFQIGNGGTTGSVAGNIVNNSELVFDRSNALVHADTISGVGLVTKQGAGTLTLSGNNNYTGGTAINEGVLAISSDANLGLGGDVILSDAALQVTASHNTNRHFGLTGNAVFDIDDGVTYTIDGPIDSSGTLVKNGPGTLELTDSNAYVGGTNVNDGTLAISSMSAAGTGDLNIVAATVSVSGAAVIGVPGVPVPTNVSITGGDLTTAVTEDTTVGLQGVASMSDGSINTRRLNVMLGGQLLGSGDVDATVLADTGSAITATGDLALGNAAAPNGFFSNGDLVVESGATTLRDANDAVFDSAAHVTLGDGAGGFATLAAASGITLDFGSNVTGFGTIDTPDNSDTPLINNGHILGNSLEGEPSDEPITLTGYVTGVGTMDNVVITGTNAPGFSPAAVNVGNVAYSDSAALVIELGGTTAGSGFDQINSTGMLNLDGTLNVDLLNGFSPGLGDTFEILTATGGINGVFDTELLPTLAGNLMLDVVYAPNAVSLVAVLPGDYNFDGSVDAADYAVWRKNPADYGSDPDGYNTWRAHFGQTAGAGATTNQTGDALAATPEPASVILMLLGVGLWTARGRK